MTTTWEKCNRNAAKARVKDTKGRLEKSFFGQRRLCAASQAMKRNNIPLEEGLGCANISLGHAKRKIPPNDDLLTSSFIPNPIDISTATPRSPRRTKRRLEAHSSGSDVGGSKVLDALDVSERQSYFRKWIYAPFFWSNCVRKLCSHDGSWIESWQCPILPASLDIGRNPQ